ncbi:MAG: DNA polymerase III subunit delta [Anaerolineae bacterium]
MLRLFLGDDRVNMEMAVAAITAQLDAAVATANVSRFDGASLDLQALTMACRSLPFLGSLRVVVVQRLADRLKSLSREAMAELTVAIASMPPSTELIVLEPDFQGDGSSHPLFGLASKQGEVRRFALAGTDDVESWIAQKAASYGTEISHDAAFELHRRVGDNSLQLRVEIEKLATYCLDQGRIEVEQVRELVAPTLESSVFDLVDAIGRKETAKALRLTQKLLLHQGEPVGRLLAMIGRQFRLLITVKDLQAARTPPVQIASQLEAPAWLVRRLGEQSQRFSMPELEKALERTLYADYATKGGANASEEAVMLQLVAELMVSA